MPRRERLRGWPEPPVASDILTSRNPSRPGVTDRRPWLQRSSTPTPTRRRCWRRTPSCRSSQAYAAKAGVDVETRDISLAGRIIAQFPERLTDEQRSTTRSPSSATLAKKPEANIIKLPNVSASIPQLKAAIKELQEQGYDLPDYPEDPKTDEEQDVRAALRQGQGLRGQPGAARGQLRPPRAGVGQELRAKPTRTDGRLERRTRRPTSRPWAHDDFRSNEKSVVIEADDTLRIELVAADGTDDRAQGRRRRCWPARSSTAPSWTSPRCAAFLTEQIARAKAEDVLFSVHLKATMMKVSDPIIFGHVVQAFFPTLFEQYGEQLAAAGLSPERRPRRHPRGLDDAARGRRRSRRPSRPGLADGPRLAMVDSDKGITNLHVPSDVIVDASMPAMIRTSGHMWGPDGARGRHPRGDPRLVATPASTRPSSTTAAPTAPSTRRPWARCPTSA